MNNHYNLITATQSVLRQYANFSGRATRAEFWWFQLASFLIALVIDVALGEDISGLVALGLLIPSLAVAVRRLHDTGRSGWNLLFVLIPFAGPIILSVFGCLDSQVGRNQYGESEKYPDTL